jgi:cell division protein FtsB
MPGNFDVNELVTTLVDQAHQVRRLNDMVVGQQAEIERLAQENAQLRGDAEAHDVAKDIRLVAAADAG